MEGMHFSVIEYLGPVFHVRFITSKWKFNGQSDNGIDGLNPVSLAEWRDKVYKNLFADNKYLSNLCMAVLWLQISMMEHAGRSFGSFFLLMKLITIPINEAYVTYHSYRVTNSEKSKLNYQIYRERLTEYVPRDFGTSRARSWCIVGASLSG